LTRPVLSVLSRDDIECIHGSSLRILRDIGVRIESPEVVSLLADAGASVDGEMVRIDEDIVSNALETVPKSVRISSRGGAETTIPQEGVQLISIDGQPPTVLDLELGRKRPSTMKDLVEMVVIADALPEVDFIWPPVVATDMPTDRSSFFEFLASITHSSKHIQHGAASPEEARFQIEVAGAILGSEEELRERPIFSDVCTPISPLRYDQGEVEALVVLARAGVPVVNLSMAIAGAVTPISIAGSLAVVNAENLCGLTIGQLANPGAPCLYSSFSGVMDLKTGVFLCGTPEGILMDSAAVQMARRYAIPCCAGGPSNAARSLSSEAGWQSAFTAMAAVAAGADMMVGLGGIDRAGIMSREKLIMDVEAHRWLKRLASGIQVDDLTIGYDALRRQGPGGTFLSDPHTLKLMRKELLIPQVTAHHSGPAPDAVADEFLESAKKRAVEILDTHMPPLLDRATAQRVGEVAKRYGIVGADGSQIFGHAE
jgi:trimethylamine--corrinoid protein Co-methyltransferase